jgi:hypothetical protein
MQSSRGSSLLRSLAVALGDGLAFAVGMKLMEAAGRRRVRPQSAVVAPAVAPHIVPLEPAPFARRVEHSPDAGSAATGRILEAFVQAVEAQLTEHAEHVDRRVASLESRLAFESQSLDQRHQAIVKRVSGDIRTLRQQMLALHRDFAASVARIVAEQVSSQVQASKTAWEQSIRAVTAAPERDREIAELRQRLAETDAKVSGLILGLGEIGRQAAGGVVPPQRPPAVGNGNRSYPSRAADGKPGPADSAASHATGPEAGEPADSAPKSNRLWRVPMVSSVVIATSGLALRHLL